MKARLLDLATAAIVWLGVIMIASGFGALAERVWETIRYGR